MVDEIVQLRSQLEEAASGTAAQTQAMAALQALPEAARAVESVEDLLAIEPWTSIFGGAKDDYTPTVSDTNRLWHNLWTYTNNLLLVC